MINPAQEGDQPTPLWSSISTAWEKWLFARLLLGVPASIVGFANPS
jgi:hypothetical protein